MKTLTFYITVLTILIIVTTVLIILMGGKPVEAPHFVTPEEHQYVIPFCPPEFHDCKG